MRRRRGALLRAVVSGALIAGSSVSGAAPDQVPSDPKRKPPANPIDYATARFERVVRALRITERITVDGRLGEPAWRRAEPATNFVQWEPDPGQPSSERTEVRFLYNDDNLSIGARCWDSDSAHLVIHELRQDFESRQSDTLAIFLDSLHDHQTGYVFNTNPSGVQQDIFFFDDERADREFDAVWEVRTAITQEGWTAEFVIPFKTLRFSNARTQEWGLNILRRIRRRNEDTYWSPLPRRYSTMRASMAGTLTGLENIRQGRNLKIKPHVISSVAQQGAGSPRGDLDGGVDLKYGLTPSVTLDLTYRTDFSQVEADQQQVNLTRFNLFFPEKREFFLENSGMFTLAGGGSDTNVYPFFSRRIGLSEAGTPIPIVGGARVSGTAGRYDLGLLAMQTEGDGNRGSDTFAVGRLRRNFWGSSAVGAIVTSRDSGRAGDSNRLYGVDTLLRFFDSKLEASSYLLRSKTPGLEGRDQARLLAVGWRGDAFTLAGQYDTVQPNFKPEVGFVRRRDMTRYAWDSSWRPRPPSNRHIRNFNLAAGTELFLDEHSALETREQTGSLGVAFHNSSMVAFNVTKTFDRLAAPFEIRRRIVLPVGDYAYQRYGVRYNSNLGRAFSGSVDVSAGEFWDGRSWSATGGLDLKPSHHLNIDLSVSHNQVDLPAGDFATTIVGLRLLYAFTSNAFFNSYLQYNATTSQLSSNTRFNIIHRPLSDLYVVYNEQRDTTSGALRERVLILKFTNLFDF